MSSLPILSIIIPTWNTADITLRCIRTIKQNLPPNYAQIIVIDNGSTDDTPAKIGRLAGIVYLRNSTNLGFAKANNLAAKQAVGSYLLFLNSDMELIDSTLINLVEYFKKNPSIGLIGPQFLNPDRTPQGSVLPSQSPFNAFREYWLGQPAYSKFTPDGHLPLKVANISGGAVLIRRDDFIKIGGWNEQYFFYYEDLELCRQIRKINKSVYYFPGCRVIHRHGASGSAVVDSANQWRRLIPGSIKYHGFLKHYLIFLIIWTSQKLFKKKLPQPPNSQ